MIGWAPQILGVDVTAILAWLTVLVAFPLSATVAVMLWKRSHQRPDLEVLGERTVTAIVVTIGVLFFGLIFVNNDQLSPPLDLDTTKLITRSVMLAMGVIPALLWLRLYVRRGRKS